MTLSAPVAKWQHGIWPANFALAGIHRQNRGLYGISRSNPATGIPFASKRAYALSSWHTVSTGFCQRVEPVNGIKG